MKKKFLSFAVVSALAAAMATSVSAATLPDQQFVGWWGSHTDGIELSDETTTITFHDVNDSGANNWNNAIFVLYNGDEAKVNGAGYAEIAVFRLDSYGWSVDKGDTSEANYPTFQENGFTFEARNADCNWDTFIADTQAGVDVTVEITNTSMTVTSSNGIDYTATFPSAKYISLGGEDATLSNISYETGSAAGGETTGGDDNTTTGGNDTTTGGNEATGGDATGGDTAGGDTAGGNNTTGDNTGSGTGDTTGNTTTGASAGLALAGLALAGAAVVATKKRQ